MLHIDFLTKNLEYKCNSEYIAPTKCLKKVINWKSSIITIISFSFLRLRLLITSEIWILCRKIPIQFKQRNIPISLCIFELKQSRLLGPNSGMIRLSFSIRSKFGFIFFFLLSENIRYFLCKLLWIFNRQD